MDIFLTHAGNSACKLECVDSFIAISKYAIREASVTF